MDALGWVANEVESVQFFSRSIYSRSYGIYETLGRVESCEEGSKSLLGPRNINLTGESTTEMLAETRLG